MNRPDLARGLSQLVVDAVDRTTQIVEGMHANISATPLPFGRGTDGRTRGIAGLTYGSIRLVNRAVGAMLDAVLGPLTSIPRASLPESDWAALRSAINGVLGDHLASSENPLAIPMSVRRDGKPLPLEGDLAAALPEATGKILLLVHGLCMSDLQWNRRGHDHGAALGRELGYTPVYLHYNSGRHVSENGRELSILLETLLARWPVAPPELAILGHSLGGLVARSALHYASRAGQRWPSRLRKLVFLGTPHHGAPLERGGNWLESVVGLSPYTSPLSRLGMLRSSGVTDLRYGNLVDEDWAAADRFEPLGDRRSVIALPEEVDCFALAGTLGKRDGDVGDRLLGDGLVPVASALGRHPKPERTLGFPESRRWVAYGCGHLALLDRSDVYARLADWLRGAAVE